MKSPLSIAPAALRAYKPGALSDIYQKLDELSRRKIADKTDELFCLKTGVYRDINEKDPADRALMRQWLLIRDFVVAYYQWEKIEREIQRGKAVRIERELRAIVSRLPTTAREKGLPELTPGLAHRAAEVGREIAEAAREFAEAGHIMESVGAVEVGLGTAEAIPAVGAAAPYVAGFAAGAAVLTGILALIGHARDVGNSQAERRAFFHGFASHLVYGTVTGSLGSGHILGRRQIEGQLAAQRLLESMPADVRTEFLARYRRWDERWPGQSLDRAYHDLQAD
jgi:hypothetical protein